MQRDNDHGLMSHTRFGRPAVSEKGESTNFYSDGGFANGMMIFMLYVCTKAFKPASNFLNIHSFIVRSSGAV